MLVTCKLLGLFVLDQSVVEVLLAGLLGAVLVLGVFELFVQFLGIYLGIVLHHDCDVLWVEGALSGREKYLEFWIVGCVLENDRLAKEGGVHRVKDVPALLKGLLVVVLIRDDDPKTILDEGVPVDVVVKGPLVELQSHSFDVFSVVSVVFDREDRHI